MPKQASTKMATSKPKRDWIYLAIISTLLFGMLTMDLVPFYPKSLTASPSAPLHFLLSLRTYYASISGDPYFSSSAVSPGQPSWFESFLYIEGLVELPLAVYLVYQLAKPRGGTHGATELAALVLGTIVAMSSVLCCFDLWHMGPGMVRAEKKGRLLYGTYMPFAVIPGIMVIDMYMRLLRRVQPTQVKAKSQ